MSMQFNFRLAAVLLLSLSVLYGCESATSQLPMLTSISPTSVTVGDPAFDLTVEGTGFTPETLVYFAGTPLTPTVATKTMLKVAVPATAFSIAKTVPVSVTGSLSSNIQFTINNPVPLLTSLSVTSVTTNSGDFELAVEGSKFVFDTKLDFGGITLTPASVTANAMTVTVPASAIAKGRVLSVQANSRGPGGGTSNGLDFTISNPLPQITSLSATSVITGSPDVTLEITGSNFVSDTTVNFGSLVLTPTSCTPNLMEVVIPARAISRGGVLRLTLSSPSPGGGMSNEIPFTVSNPVPSIAALSPPSVTADEGDLTLMITGAGFVPDSRAAIQDMQLSTTFISSTQVAVIVPAGAIAQEGTINLKASNPGPGGGDSNLLAMAVRARAQLAWTKVANSNDRMPNTTKNFNSYSQPSVNSTGLVVFKGQSKGSESSAGSTSGPVRGIYTRRMSASSAPINTVVDNSTPVPQPNNTVYNEGLATFTQYPSFARIDRESDTAAFRGQHQPVYTYTLPDGSETRIGSAGLYSDPAGTLTTGVGLMALAPGYEFFQVPGAAPGTRFDQFPGSPAVVSNHIIAFKGNYTEGDIGETGVFYRDIISSGGKAPVELIASTSTVIPNQPAGGMLTFGSTAPPSGTNGYVLFTGWDNEDSPTVGGIYLAPLAPNPPLQTLVGLSTQVPAEPGGTTFKQLGEGLSFDGRFLAFWASWGSETRTISLDCATDGNKDRLADCNAQYPNGFQTEIPLHQGIFVYDILTGQLAAVAKSPVDFDDFLYWVFSGRATGTTHGGGEEGEDVVPEPPRWRASAFMAVSGQGNSEFTIAFKAKLGTIDGIYLAQGPASATIQTVLDTRMLGSIADAQAPAAAIIATVGVERDSFRGNWLAVSASMLDSATSAGLGGVYVTHAPPAGFGPHQ